MASETETETKDEQADNEAASADNDADNPKAEEAKAEASEEAKAEASEEAKAEASEEPKAEASEEPKAEEPKAEEPKAEEPKAEEPKAEEPKAAKKGVSPAKQVLNKKKDKKEAEVAQRDSEEPPKSPQEIFQENLPLILVLVLLLAVVFVWWTYDDTSRRGRSEAAWSELAKLEKDTKAPAEKFATLAAEHKGSSADPYIKIAWASKLYESGERDKVEQARDLLKAVLAENQDNEMLRRILPGQIEKISDELENKSIPWQTKKAEEGKPEESTPEAPGSTDPETPSEDEHAGHDHGDEGDAPEAPAADGSAPPAEGGN